MEWRHENCIQMSNMGRFLRILCHAQSCNVNCIFNDDFCHSAQTFSSSNVKFFSFDCHLKFHSILTSTRLTSMQARLFPMQLYGPIMNGWTTSRLSSLNSGSLSHLSGRNELGSRKFSFERQALYCVIYTTVQFRQRDLDNGMKGRTSLYHARLWE